MAENINLNAGMRGNLLALQNIQKNMNVVQNRLATGLKVNSAIDNPSSYYTAKSLNARATDLSSLLDNMGQAVQTIVAANEGIESGTQLLEQAKSVTLQALEAAGADGVSGGGLWVKSTADFVSEGYTAITSGMSAAEIQGLITAGAKLVLDGDITLSSGLNLNQANVTLDGNGHKINYNTATVNDDMVKVSAGGVKINNVELNYSNSHTTAGEIGGSAVFVDGAGASVEISAITINTTGKRTYGIRASNGATVALDNTLGISVSGTGSQKVVNGDPRLFDGKSNTQAIVDQIGADGLAATAASQFYVGDKNGDFGQGNWYLPSVGELMQVYGYDVDGITYGAGMTGSNKSTINAALNKLAGVDGSATALTNGYYWSSSEYSSTNSFGLVITMGGWGSTSKYNEYLVRCVQLVENCFTPLSLSGSALGGGSGGSAAPQVGDIMYDDKTYGSADSYDGSKTAVGVIINVSEDGRDATIMSLKNLTFSSNNLVNNFDPENPFTGAVGYTNHTTHAKYSTDIAEIKNYDSTNDSTDFLNAIKSANANITISNTITSTGGSGSGDKTIPNSTSYNAQYNNIITQYSNIIKDASYNGVNLLTGGRLEVNFNETGSSKLEVEGVDADLGGLGINTANLSKASEVKISAAELEAAIATLRQYAGAFGSDYSIIETYQNFTEKMINVLTAGADGLTLADMNEESANMLSLQTAQQLAINSLSLAAQSSQSVLKLFA